MRWPPTGADSRIRNLPPLLPGPLAAAGSSLFPAPGPLVARFRVPVSASHPKPCLPRKSDGSKNTDPFGTLNIGVTLAESLSRHHPHEVSPQTTAGHRSADRRPGRPTKSEPPLSLMTRQINHAQWEQRVGDEPVSRSAHSSSSEYVEAHTLMYS